MAINISNLQGQANQLGSARSGNKVERNAGNAADNAQGVQNQSVSNAAADPVSLTAEAKHLG